MIGAVFVDASAWVAIINRKDQYHLPSVQLYRELVSGYTPLVTTTWTAYEALTIVKSKVGPEEAEELWKRLNTPQLIDLLRVSEDAERLGLDMFLRYKDKTWGVVDCTSFVIMERVRCQHAFAFDEHFREAARQSGFKVLPD